MKMRVGVIGLGDIAKKAYLPVLTERENIELVLCTRNEAVLQKLAEKYRIQDRVQTVEELLLKNIEAAFISTITEAHFQTAELLLQHGIHVYIDKPVSLYLHETERIVELAHKYGLIAMVGFNRRFIPMVASLKEKGKANLILMQKNRFALPDIPRKVVVEDFIHVVDTLRFLMDEEVIAVNVESSKTDETLNQLIVQLIGKNCIAIGIMNRNGGVTEEIIEYHTGLHKYVVSSLVETVHYHHKQMNVTKFGDWEPTLFKRGFHQITDHFLDCVANEQIPDPSIEDSLITHLICEQIVQRINN